MDFMQKADDSCSQAFNRYQHEPIMLIICVDKVDGDTQTRVKSCEIPGVYSYFSKPWTKHYYILADESINSPSLKNHPFNGDPTIQYLYIIANIPALHFDFQVKEYDRFLKLAGSVDAIVEVINDAKCRTLALKRKYEEEFVSEVAQPPTTTMSIVSDKEIKYEEGMKFVAEFKKRRTEEGKGMNWRTCLKNGKDLNVLSYKNSESLRQQFLKHSKRRSNI